MKRRRAETGGKGTRDGEGSGPGLVVVVLDFWSSARGDWPIDFDVVSTQGRGRTGSFGRAVFVCSTLPQVYNVSQ